MSSDVIGLQEEVTVSTGGAFATSGLENGFSEKLDMSDGEGGSKQACYEMNSDKDSQCDSISEDGSYTLTADNKPTEDSVLEQGTYRKISQPTIPIDVVDAGGDDVQGMCDDSDSEIGSYHVNENTDEEDGVQISDASDAEYDMSSGEESDIEDNMDDVELLRLKYLKRQQNPVLPKTVTVLETEEGAKVYLIGTAHFSMESQDDVAKTIEAVQPDLVMVELCKSRLSIMQLDEETLLEEAKNINMDKLRLSIRQSGLVSGVMQVLLLSLSAHLTKELGMAPGGEFRRAFREAQRVPGCKISLGDRPIQITLNRAMAELSVWQKMRLAWYMITSKDPITKEDVEKCKQKDLLEEMLEEMTGEFPALSRVFVTERDMFLANSLQMCTQPLYSEHKNAFVAPVVVGVVGIGHTPGIVENWNKPPSTNQLQEIMKVPGRSLLGHVLRLSIRASVLGTIMFGFYRCYRWCGGPHITSFIPLW
ncbi:traB domain-containing protein-like [Anneissia japonica]|uniref:traB domain-containing protein-like n=1 Tax=Anneissia japonica TaxID=1529436 RepID=UPI00142590D9|nr:traB domain-containing protein-like [Anneissia japonica]XP_033105619.1 traB domain-containing protein-like [Anneissia japonica]